MDETTRPVVVRGKDGWQGTLVVNNTSQAGVKQGLLQLNTGQQLVVPLDILQLQNDGTYYLPFALAELETSYGGSLQGQAAQAEAAETIVIPVIAEELEIQKRQVATGGIRLHKVVHQREEVIDQPLVEDEVKVVRVAVNQVVAQAPEVRYEGDTMIVPVLEEVVVTEKRLILKEELRITRRKVTVNKPQSVILRSEEITVEEIVPAPAPVSGSIPVSATHAHNPQTPPLGSM